MTHSNACPAPADLEMLLAGRMPDLPATDLAAHLSTCVSCQRRLEGFAADSKFAERAAHIIARFAAPAQPALRKAIAALKAASAESAWEAPSGTAPPELDFLSPPTQAGQLGRLDHYEVVELIGQGGMGVVMKAFDPSLHRFVAVKVLAPGLAVVPANRQRFLREARAAAAVSHEHVITIHAVGEANDLPYLVMEYIRGVSLQERLDGRGKPDLKEILRIGMQIAAGLAAAHSQGLVHRDIKPANILLENGVERVKITDFGLARAVDDSSLTQPGALAGTPQYMAPEQARGEPLDARADLFSLGSLLYALCTGRVAFAADTTVAVLYNVLETTPCPIQKISPDIPDWLVAIVDKLHAKNPIDRFQSAAEVSELLASHLGSLQQPQAAATPRSPLAQSALPAVALRTRRRLVLSATVAVLAITALGMTEAFGVTRIADWMATTLRIQTPYGTLVLEVNDPDVKVSVAGEGEEIVIQNAGVHEVRVRPGTHVLNTTRKGVSQNVELLAIKRGEKQVFRIKREASDRGTSRASSETVKLRSFTSSDQTVTQDGIVPDGKGWRMSSDGNRAVHLFEVSELTAQECVLSYRARLKTEKLLGRAYLEMWCRLPGLGEFFSRGLQSPVTGTSNWASVETPFFLKKGQRPDLVRLNLVIEGKGTVWLEDVELDKGPLPAEMAGPPGPTDLRTPASAQMSKIKSLDSTATPITQDNVTAADGGWRIESSGKRTIRLFEVVAATAIEECLVMYRVRMRTGEVTGRVYLEMWCRVPGWGESFSRGFHNAVQGSTGWATYEIPFRLEKGQRPDLFKLNLVMEGKGTVWLKDVELLRMPLPN